MSNSVISAPNRRNMWKSILLVSFLTVLMGCNSADIVEPGAEIIAPVAQTTWISGQTYPVITTHTDNDYLKQYSITILILEDPTLEADKMEVPYTFGQSYGIEGASATDTLLVDIPKDVSAGSYRIAVQSLDRSANLSGKKEVIVTLKNANDQIAPTLSLVSPTANITTTTGSPVTIKGTIKDESQLGGLFCKIIDPPTGAVIRSLVVPFDKVTQQFDVNMPAPGVAGNYTLRIEAADRVNNRTRQEFSLTVN